MRQFIARWLIKRHIRKTNHQITAMPGGLGIHVYCCECDKEWVY